MQILNVKFPFYYKNKQFTKCLKATKSKQLSSEIVLENFKMTIKQDDF